MAKLKEQGKIRHIGLSNFDVPQIQRAQAVAPIASLQPQYSLVAPEAGSAILPYALKQRMGVIVYSPMGSGLLTGSMTRERIAALPEDDWRKHSPNFQEPLLSRNLQLVGTLRAIGRRHNASPGEVAIAWTLRNPAVTGAIVGVRSSLQVKGIAGGARLELAPNDIGQIEGHFVRKAA
jgi:aryl-alcohol dehydrogenase-like predicted oxidoreductase